MLLTETGPVSEGRDSLVLSDVAEPEPREGEVLLQVAACGVCHTELDEIEGRTPPSHLPMIPGHQVIGEIVARGAGVTGVTVGQRVGVAWIFWACGHCERCAAGDENLCAGFRATGRDANGGYAEYMTVPAAFAHEIPECFGDAEAAPLLCAGAVGYRSLRLTAIRNGMRLGLTGFGASGHLVMMMVRHRYPDTEVYVFARQQEEREFALQSGATWVGDTLEPAPAKLHAIIDTTPAWLPLVKALENLEPGGRLVVNAIRKEDADRPQLLSLDYPRHLWLEKEIKSVANVTRRDVREFLDLAAAIPIRPVIETYALHDANRALRDLKLKHVRGAKVLCAR
ncbi:MAG: zinc-dependent alcohol dehydrogenase family protein [Steroidobacteraceae bacterium]|nr:zinc-dependent alcohol dehydrogenase family protein [Steroidobacteraceae bacterium]